MKTIPELFLTPAETSGTVISLPYRNKNVLLYTPAKPAERILYLIHGGGRVYNILPEEYPAAKN